MGGRSMVLGSAEKLQQIGSLGMELLGKRHLFSR